VSDATAQMFDPNDPNRPVKAFLQEYQTLAIVAGKSLPTIRHQIYALPNVRNEFMISNERPSPYKSWAQMQPRQPVQEDTLKSGEVQIERKTFVLTLKENPRGRFLRISEDAVGRRNAIIIPSTGLAEFEKLLEEMIKVSNELPLKYPPET
jgi:hypothetical protein